MKQTARKWIISLKRRPQNIPLLMLLVCACIYTFNLTAHSNAAMYVSSTIIAIHVFVITLLSILVIFSFINVYSPRAKHRALMKGIVYVLILVQMYVGFDYWRIMYYEIYQREDRVPITADIAASMNNTMIHIIALGITLVVILCIPLYHKLLLKINTTIEDEEEINYDADEFELEEDV